MVSDIMKKKPFNLTGKTILCNSGRFMIALCLCLFNISVLLSQTGQPVFEAQVDSLKKVYLDMGMDDEAAEFRARSVISQQQEINTRTGYLNVDPNPGSIHVNRNLTYRAFTPTQLVDSIFVKGGACSAVNNVTLTTHGWNSTTSTWTDNDTRGLGYFSRGTSNFEMEEGLVLTTGTLVSIEGPNGNSNGVVQGSSLRTGDSDLNTLLPTGQSTTNVSILEFDFTPVSNFMQFRYIFASEEYSYYVRRNVNDVFGFFISGPVPKQNIAQLPTTNSGRWEVSIDNVNAGQSTNYSIHNCPPFTAPVYNTQYYINIPGSFSNSCGWPLIANSRNDTLYKSMEFNGRTVVLTATYPVTPCTTYHLKLAVGNVSDQNWQSGVFLEARSFDIGERIINWGSMNEDQDFVYRGCYINKFDVIRTNGNNLVNDTLYLTYSGTAMSAGDISPISGLSLPAMVVIPIGVDTVHVDYRVNATNIGMGHTVFTITSQCPCGGGSYVKNIDVYDPSNTSDFQAVATPACPDQNNGTITINPGSGGIGAYETSIDGGLTWQLSNSSGYTYTGLAPGNYTVLIRDQGGCSYVNVSVSTIMKPTLSGSPDLCPPTYSTTLTVSGVGAIAYQWYRNGTLIGGATSATYNATTIGEYYAKVSNNGTCYSLESDTITVITSNCLYAFDDSVQTLREKPVTIPVLANDSLGTCPSLTPVIIAPFTTDGSATVVGNQIEFTPNIGFTGTTEVHYQITCGAKTSTATVFIRVWEYHDNVVDSTGCVIPFETINFNIRRKWNSANNTASSYTGALVGDLDGDGIPEIVTYDAATRLYILDGSTGVTKTSISIPSSMGTNGWCPVITGALVNSDPIANGMGELILATNDNRLTSYEADTTGGVFTMQQKWQTTFISPAGGSADNRPQPIVADFNGDGVPEVVVYHRIYNAGTGAYLGQTEAVATAYTGRVINRGDNNMTNFMTAVDFDGDGLPEIVAGGKIYKVTINPAGTSASCSILYQTVAFNDGFTSVADVNLDGHPDVVVVDCSGGSTRLNIWSPKTGSVLQQITIPNSNNYQGYAFIGDIDGDVEPDGKRYPEICVTTIQTSPLRGKVSAYKYNPAGSPFYSLKWNLINSDTSGGTGITLFDFNNDGTNELVYRDMDSLYILNGVNNATPTVRAKFRCTSGTAFEYPVIADLDGS